MQESDNTPPPSDIGKALVEAEAKMVEGLTAKPVTKLCNVEGCGNSFVVPFDGPDDCGEHEASRLQPGELEEAIELAAAFVKRAAEAGIEDHEAIQGKSPLEKLLLDTPRPAPPPRQFKCKLGGEIYTGEIAEWKEAAEACLSGEGVCQLEEIGPDGKPLDVQPPPIDIEIKVVAPEPAPFYVCHKRHRQQGGFFHTIPPNPAAGSPGMRFGPACRQCLFEWIAQKFRTRLEKKKPHLESVPANDVAPAEPEPEAPPEPA